MQHSILSSPELIKVGIIASGFAAGYSFAASHLAIHSLLYTPKLNPSQISYGFSPLFTKGATIILPLVLTSSLSYITAGYTLQSSSATTVLGFPRSVQLYLAAASTLSTLAWTRLRMMPGIDRLREIAVKGKGESGGDGDVGAMRADLEDWGWTNYVRAFLHITGCVLGVTAL